MNKIIRWFFESPLRCIALGILDLIICVFAVYSNVLKVTGGNIQSLQDFQNNLTADDMRILSFGLVACLVLFMLGWNAKREDKLF